jgi:hypothetical protein
VNLNGRRVYDRNRAKIEGPESHSRNRMAACAPLRNKF